MLLTKYTGNYRYTPDNQVNDQTQGNYCLKPGMNVELKFYHFKNDTDISKNRNNALLLLFIYFYKLYCCDIYCYTTFQPHDRQNVYCCNQSYNGSASTLDASQ